MFKVGDIFCWGDKHTSDHFKITKLQSLGRADIILIEKKGKNAYPLGYSLQDWPLDEAAGNMVSAKKIEPKGHPLTKIFKD